MKKGQDHCIFAVDLYSKFATFMTFTYGKTKINITIIKNDYFSLTVTEYTRHTIIKL
jgi:hypothetical protein